MEAPETPRRRKKSLLWIIPLLVVAALSVDSALTMYRDSQAKAATVAQGSPGMNCGGGDCKDGGGDMKGMMGGDKAAKGADTKADAGKCPMMSGKQGMGQKASGDAGKCPMMSGKQGAAKTAPTGKGSCPMMGGAKTEAAKCPDGASCGKKAGEACDHGGNGSCPKHTTSATTKPAAAAKHTETASGATYICTMCPDVKSDKPGKCPKCGMALVKK